MELSRREREQQDREKYIISKATLLFCEYGFENVSMDQIARESEFTKRTIYRYFESKEDLYFAAALKGHQILYNDLENAQMKGSNGFEKLKYSFYAYYDFCKNSPALSQLVNSRQYIKIEKKTEGSNFYQKFNHVNQLIFNDIYKLFELGVNDGSIMNKEDINYLTYTTIYSTVSFFHLFSFSGQSFIESVHLDSDQFVHFFIEHILNQIKSK